MKLIISHRSLSMLMLVLLLATACAGGGSSKTSSAGPSKLIISEDFDTCGFNSLWGDGAFVRYEYYPSNVSPFVHMEGHGCALQQYIPANSNEITPAQVGISGAEAFTRLTRHPDADEFYVEWEEYYTEDHLPAHGGQKMLRFSYYQEGQPPGAQLNFASVYSNTMLQLIFYHPGDDHHSTVDFAVKLNQSVPYGRWVSFAVWAKLNTPGESDGFAYAYMDGSQIVAREYLNLRNDDSRGWNLMWVGGNYTNSGPTSRATTRIIDNVRWYNTKPAK